MIKTHKCGFRYDDSITVDTGNISWSEELKCLIGYNADVVKLNNLNPYLEEGKIFMAMDTGGIKIFSKTNNTWYDL